MGLVISSSVVDASKNKKKNKKKKNKKGMQQTSSTTLIDTPGPAREIPVQSDSGPKPEPKKTREGKKNIEDAFPSSFSAFSSSPSHSSSSSGPSSSSPSVASPSSSAEESKDAIVASAVLGKCLPNRNQPDAAEECRLALKTVKGVQAKGVDVIQNIITGFEDVKRTLDDSKDVNTQDITSQVNALLTNLHQKVFLGKGTLEKMTSAFAGQEGIEKMSQFVHSAVVVAKHIKSGETTDPEMREHFEALSWYCSENVTDKKFVDPSDDYVEHSGRITIDNVEDDWFHLASNHFGPIINTPESSVAITPKILKGEALFWFKNLGWTLSELPAQLGEAFQKAWRRSHRSTSTASSSTPPKRAQSSWPRGPSIRPTRRIPIGSTRDAYVTEMMSKVKRTEGGNDLRVLYIEMWLRTMHHKNLEALLEYANGPFKDLIEAAGYIPPCR